MASNVVNISENIAWDGRYFFCRRCGKSGYEKMSQVRGHLAMCRGKAIQKGAIPESQPVGNYLQLVATASKANLQGVSTGWQPAAVGPSYNRLEARVGKLENEYNHMLIQKNTGGFSDWLSENKGALILAGFILLVILVLRETESKNDTGTPVRSNKRSGIGSTLVGKAASKAIDYGLGKLFK